MIKSSVRLRVAFLAGGMSQGGAEKQFVYMVKALLNAGVDVRIYSLTKGEYYQPFIEALGVQPVWIGRFASPATRLIILSGELRNFRPQIVQSTHFFANLYVAFAAQIFGAISIGSIRADTLYEMNSNGFWSPWLLRLPSVLLTNSETAKINAVKSGILEDKVHVLNNVIDLKEFDKPISNDDGFKALQGKVISVAVARLIEAKRLERFLNALALARREADNLVGILIGDGPERIRLQNIAINLGLFPKGLQFIGRRDDVPALLRQADMLVHTSDHEGFPNVILEAMAARLPVISTPAGDVKRVVKDDVTGYVVPFDDNKEMAARIISLANSPDLRHRLGENGRQLVEQRFKFENLAESLFSLYKSIAERKNNEHVLNTLGYYGDFYNY